MGDFVAAVGVLVVGEDDGEFVGAVEVGDDVSADKVKAYAAISAETNILGGIVIVIVENTP